MFCVSASSARGFYELFQKYSPFGHALILAIWRRGSDLFIRRECCSIWMHARRTALSTRMRHTRLQTRPVVGPHLTRISAAESTNIYIEDCLDFASGAKNANKQARVLAAIGRSNFLFLETSPFNFLVGPVTTTEVRLL